MLEKSTEEVIPLNSSEQRFVKLTKDSEERVIKVEIYVDELQRRQIFDYFPDKTLNWKESASHFLILKNLASYQNKKLTDKHIGYSQKNKINLKKSPLPLNPDSLADLVKQLCHITAPLYSLVNNSYLDSFTHPLYSKWMAFRKEKSTLNDVHLKIAFLKKSVK